MKAYEKFIGQLGKLDPRSENFEKYLDENFIKFQEELDIPKQFQIRAANFVIHPIEISENGILNQIVGKPLPDEITLDRIWKLYGSQVGTGKIDGETYFVDTERMAEKYIDESGKLFEAPFFEQAVGNDYKVNNEINDTASMIRTLLPERQCKNGKEPQFEEESLKKASEASEVFFEKFKTSIKSDFYAPGQQLSRAEMLTILSAVKGVEPHGFSVKQLKNSSDPTCLPQKPNPQIFFKKVPIGNYDILASYKKGVVAIANHQLKRSTVTHELFHSLNNGHEDTISINARLLNMSNLVPMTVMGVSKLYLPAEQVEKNTLGVLDYIRTYISRYLSIKNKGDEKFNEISRCYESFESFKIDTIKELENKLRCEDGSTPTLTANNINIDINEILKKFNKNLLLIEGSAIIVRGATEIAGNVAKIDKKTLGAISSSLENTTRLTAIGLVYGIESVANSIAVPVLVSGAKAADAIITKFSGSGLQDGIHSLSKCLIGDGATNSISSKVSAYYNSTPKYVRDMASQIIFISMIYNILEIQNNMKEDEVKKSSAFAATLLSSLLTSVASGILRFGSNVFVDALFSSRSPAQPSNDLNIELARQTPAPNPTLGTQQRITGIPLEPSRERRGRYEV